ncbi:MAG: hypothetical protein RIG82_08695 [Phycisphaeraceae bacterium]
MDGSGGGWWRRVRGISAGWLADHRRIAGWYGSVQVRIIRTWREEYGAEDWVGVR